MRPISDSLKRRQTGRTRKTKIARKGLAQKRGEKGDAAKYMTRNKVLKKLQLPLKSFRRLAILKGIYPRVPNAKGAAAKGGRGHTYYLTKDIAFLAHEPVLRKFRETKAFMKKVKKAIGRRRKGDARRLWETQRPSYTLDHLVRERYPSFVDALRDLDDALCMVHLFAVLPRGNRIPAGRSDNCARLAREFQYIVARGNALRKCFLSVKGVYFQAEIMGQTVTWLSPYAFAQELTDDVDYRVMLTFLEFYETAMRFVNYRLFHDMGLAYPPRFLAESDLGGGFIEGLEVATIGGGGGAGGEGDGDDGANAASSSSSSSKTGTLSKAAAKKLQGKVSKVASGLAADDDAAAGADGAEGAAAGADFADAEEVLELRRKNRAEAICEELFADCVMFFSREVPRASVELVARSFGARVGWEGAGSPYEAKDAAITHFITDRDPKHIKMVNGRHYVQPQWVVDCANERIVLPCGSYAPGKALPPHLSPFVDDSSVGYTPDQRRRLDTLKERIAAGTLIDEGDTLEAIVPDSAIGGATDGDAGSDSEDDSDADGDSDAGGDDDDTDAGDSSDEEEDDEDDGEANEAEAAYQAELRGERGGADADAAGRKAKQAVAQKRKRKQEADDNEATEMAKVMMSKKDRRLYGQIAYTNRKKQEAAEKLEAKKLAAKKARK